MNYETLIEIDNIKKKYEISNKVFKQILTMAITYQRYNPNVSDEDLGLIIKETMLLFDNIKEEYNELNKGFKSPKITRTQRDLHDAFNEALCNLELRENRSRSR